MGSINGSVDLRHDGDIAVITFSNPPVNALNDEVRTGVTKALQQACADASTTAIVLASAGRTFSAGADIKEFGKPATTPTLLDLIASVEATPVPVVAALYGTALGGGFELALSCHFRVASPGARFGLPEIKLGLMPGAGGTQRLPRLIGAEKTLKMVLSGDPMPVTAAVADGLVDEIVEGDLTAGAVAFARRVIAEKRPVRLVRDRDEKLAAMRADPKPFEDAAKTLTGRSSGLRAPAAAVEAVRHSFTLPITEGLQRERASFLDLLAGDQSRAQRHVFFAEREAAKLPGAAATAKPRDIKRATVIGGGTMGGGIAMCFANVGIPVTIVETGQDALKKGLDRIAANYQTTVTRGNLSPDEMQRRMGQIAGSTDFGAVADADMVIEAVFEDMDLKKKVFADLNRLARPDSILASNTSMLDVNALGSCTQRPEQVLGMHFFSPANVMKLLEVVRGEATSPEALATAMATGRKIGKIPVVVGVCDGFVGNRMLARRSAETERLLLEGAAPQDVDAAVMEFGFPMGPFAMNDLVGLDVSWRIRQARGLKHAVADMLCEGGRFGQKSGGGYYRYEPGSRTPLPDPKVEKIIADASKRLGVTRRNISKEEITERMIFPIINEGARVLEEGIAVRPSDVDVIWVYGYGWPAWRGGPMFHADLTGLPLIVERLTEYASRSRDKTLEPAPLLKRLAASGKGFASLAEGGGN